MKCDAFFNHYTINYKFPHQQNIHFILSMTADIAILREADYLRW